ncbi:hypothetical protein H0H92_006825 [Tricholoma furcatifolium]|nr:hypothetical protein H0H92_006825 [Tricholoma furcatifolium]
MSATHNILLSPRPYAQFSGKLLLLPLLPSPQSLKALPTEIWSEIVAYVLLSEGSARGATLPLVYAWVDLPTILSLERFQRRLHSAEQKWDSLRRIPYSTPGRWVQALDLSKLAFTGQAQALQFDSLLTTLFPLVPFLARLTLNPSFVLNRRAMAALGEREEAVNVRSLRGISYVPNNLTPNQDPFIQLLRHCVNLDELDVVGSGPEPAELEFNFQNADTVPAEGLEPLDLQRLHTLSLISMFNNSLMMTLLFSPLPSLRKLTLTPYDDIPYPSSLASQFISVHGERLRSLALFTPKSWPSRLHPSPSTLLQSSPHLRHLSLEQPVPALTITGLHPLQILSIPRPTVDLWRLLNSLFSHLPELYVIQTWDVRWLRTGMNSRAQAAGVQGDMQEWKRRLSRRRIRLLDKDWSDTRD